MGYTAELNAILEELKEVDGRLKEERQKDDFDRKRLKALTDKKSRIIIQRDTLIYNNKNNG